MRETHLFSCRHVGFRLVLCRLSRRPVLCLIRVRHGWFYRTVGLRGCGKGRRGGGWFRTLEVKQVSSGYCE